MTTPPTRSSAWPTAARAAASSASRPASMSSASASIGRPVCVVYIYNLYTYTVVAISIRSSNFGWARPNRVVSQAVFQKIAAGHPKFGSEREVRASTWGFALIASRLDAPRDQKKPFLHKKTPKKLGQVGGWVSAGGSSPWEFSALTAFGRSSRAKKSKRQTIFLAAQTGLTLATHTAMSDLGGPAGPAVPPPALPAPRASEFTAPSRRAACPMSSIRNLSWPSERRFQKSAKSVRSLN